MFLLHRFNGYPCSLPRIKDFVTIFSKPFCPMIFAGTQNPESPQPRLGSHARTGAWKAIAALCAAALGACNASDDSHPLRGAATTVGWATTAGQPKDFVLARRSATELSYVPVGRGGIERPVQPRSVEGVREFESALDRTRDQSEAFARRALPRGAYGAAFPSVAAPPRPARAASGRADQPTAGAPESYPVSAGRARQLRDNARNAQ
jgi:hypothetical protein